MAQVKRIRRNVSGIILLDKPLGFTSNAALQKVRWLLNAEKAGHTGSLDPLATGVLPLCFGLVWYGIVFSGLNALVLWIRIRAEAAALRQ